MRFQEKCLWKHWHLSEAEPWMSWGRLLQHTLHSAKMSIRGLGVLLRRTHSKCGPVPVASLCMCVLRGKDKGPEDEQRGHGGPIDRQWPANSSTCHWVPQHGFGCSPTAVLLCFHMCAEGGVFVTLGGWPDHTRLSSLARKALLSLWAKHHTERMDTQMRDSYCHTT